MTESDKRRPPLDKNVRVLVMDDEPTVLTMLERVLSDAGYAVEVAASGGRAIELIEHLPIGVAVLDKNVPDITGLEVLRRARRMVPLIKAIVLTGHPSLDSAVEALRHGAFDYLAKPVHLELLLEKVARALEAFQLSVEREALIERHETLFELVPGITWFLTDNGIFKRINNEGARMLGYEPEELIGRSYEELMVPTGDSAAHWAFKERRTGDRATHGKLIEIKTKNGETRLLELHSSGAYFPRAAERPRRTAECYWGTVGVAVDITRQFTEQHERQHAQKMEALGRLAGGIAHDFNNILAVIQSNVFLMGKTLPADSLERSDLAEIESSCERAADLTRQLLSFSRKEPSSAGIIHLSVTIRETEKMLSRLLGEDIRLTIRCADDMGMIRADPRQIEQVIVNLCVNARDAMPDGGELSIDVGNVYLDEQHAEIYRDVTPGDYVMIAVSDNGQGMSPQIRHRMFEPFFTTKQNGSGTGLGLATVFGIVRRHEGHLSVYSEQGVGTTVKVYLPRVQVAPVDKQPPSESPSRGAGEQILLVEDDHTLRRSMARILRVNGYQVIDAPDAETALEIIRSEQPLDLLFTDMVLPKMNGDELGRLTRELRPAIKVLYTSGYLGGSIAGALELRSGEAFLAKPVAALELFERLRELLD